MNAGIWQEQYWLKQEQKPNCSGFDPALYIGGTCTFCQRIFSAAAHLPIAQKCFQYVACHLCASKIDRPDAAARAYRFSAFAHCRLCLKAYSLPLNTGEVVNCAVSAFWDVSSIVGACQPVFAASACQ
jgi:hypothetical protein